MDMDRSMLCNPGLSAQFWGEAVTTSADICNHVGRRKCGLKTLLELLTGKPLCRTLQNIWMSGDVHIPKTVGE